MIGQQRGIAGVHLVAADLSHDATTGNHLEMLRLCGAALILLAKALDDGLAQWVLAAQLGACHKTVQVFLGPLLAERFHRHHFRRAIGQRAGLVESDVSHIRQPFQRIALAHKKTMLRHIANGRHDGRRRGQYQRTRTEHDEDGYRANDFARHQPSNQRRRQRNDDDPGRPAVGQADDLRLASVHRLHEANHALDGAVFTDLGGAHIKGAELVHCTRRHLVADALVHRHRLAGHHCLVNRRFAARDDAVHRHRFTWQHAQHITDSDGFCRNHRLSVAIQPSRRAWGQVHELLDARPGTRHGQLFQKRTQLHDEGNLAGGEIFTDEHRCHERQRNEHVRLDVEGGDETDDGLQNNRNPAENDRHPGQIHACHIHMQQTQHESKARDHQEGDVSLYATPLQQSLQFFYHKPFPHFVCKCLQT